MTKRNLKRQAGMSLIEVLVSVVILAVALLGTAKLTSSSLKSTNTAYYRSQATVLADDILDRMRANIVGTRAGQYAIDVGGTMVAPSGSFAEVDCDEWLESISSTLPEGTGEIQLVGSAATGITATITISWEGETQNIFKTVSQL